MRKFLLPAAAILGWSVALAALSSFEAMDADRDGAVSAREQAMDGDRDGQLSAAEINAAPSSPLSWTRARPR